MSYFSEFVVHQSPRNFYIVGNTLYFPTPFPGFCIKFRSEDNYLPLKLALSHQITSKIGGFWTSIFTGGDTPKFGHAFSNRTHWNIVAAFEFRSVNFEGG